MSTAQSIPPLSCNITGHCNLMLCHWIVVIHSDYICITQMLRRLTSHFIKPRCDQADAGNYYLCTLPRNSKEILLLMQFEKLFGAISCCHNICMPTAIYDENQFILSIASWLFPRNYGGPKALDTTLGVTRTKQSLIRLRSIVSIYHNYISFALFKLILLPVARRMQCWRKL